MRERYSLESAQREAELVRDRAVLNCVRGLRDAGKWTHEEYLKYSPDFRHKNIDILIGWRDYDRAHKRVMEILEDLASPKPDLNPQQEEEWG